MVEDTSFNHSNSRAVIIVKEPGFSHRPRKNSFNNPRSNMFQSQKKQVVIIIEEMCFKIILQEICFNHPRRNRT